MRLHNLSICKIFSLLCCTRNYHIAVTTIFQLLGMEKIAFLTIFAILVPHENLTETEVKFTTFLIFAPTFLETIQFKSFASWWMTEFTNFTILVFGLPRFSILALSFSVEIANFF